MTQDPIQSLPEFHKYYSFLYQASVSEDPDQLWAYLQSEKLPRLATAHRELMDSPITPKEILESHHTGKLIFSTWARWVLGDVLSEIHCDLSLPS